MGLDSFLQLSEIALRSRADRMLNHRRTFLLCALYLLAPQRHGKQEDGDFLYGGEEDSGQRGEAADILFSVCLSDDGCPLCSQD